MPNEIKSDKYNDLNREKKSFTSLVNSAIYLCDELWTDCFYSEGTRVAVASSMEIGWAW